MFRNQPGDALLDEAHAAFITHRVSMNVASCNAAREPSIVRAHGCRVSADRRRVTVFVPAARAAAVIADLRAGGAIAVAFTRPCSHETLQLKSAKADIVPLAADDPERIRTYARGFGEEIHSLGYRESFSYTIVSGLDDEHVGLSFEPAAAFVQTPGPNAGRPLGTKS